MNDGDADREKDGDEIYRKRDIRALANAKQRGR